MYKSSVTPSFMSAVVAALIMQCVAFGQEVKVEGSEGSVALTAPPGITPAILLEHQGVLGRMWFRSAGPSVGRWIFNDAVKFELRSEPLGTDVWVEAPGVVLASENPSQRYLVDSDNDHALSNHIWYENTLAGSDRMMQLTETNGGSLFIAGTLTQSQSFDIAENFWEREPVDPGELVAIDVDSPNSVRPTRGAYETTLLGVASSKPGIVLGGGAFSTDTLIQVWGEEIAAEYQRQRPALESQVLNDTPDLRAASDRLRSQSSFEAHLAQKVANATLEEGGTIPRKVAARWPQERANAYEEAKRDLETQLFDKTVALFFNQRFTAVALAGRVPVKADASFGAIRPGDYLTSSPVPGLAMKATQPGPIIGTALSSLSGGAGTVQVFVHRGWFAGQGTPILGTELANQTISHPKDAEIADLRRQLTELEQRLNNLTNSNSWALAQSTLNNSAVE